MQNKVMPLAFLTPGTKAVIKEIRGGKTARQKLYDLGLFKNTTVKSVQNNRGPLIVLVGESRVALGFGMARKVLVEELF